MRSLYASRFWIVDEAGKETLFARVQTDVQEWLRERVLLRTGEAPPQPLPPACTVGSTHISTMFQGQLPAAGLWSLDYAHPDDSGDDRQWRSTIRLAVLDGSPVEVHVTVASGRAGHHLVPDLPSFIGRPKIVQTLFSKYHCGINSWPLSRLAKMIDADEVEREIVQSLYSAERPVPMVVVAPDLDGNFALDSAKLADVLAGLADVRVLSDTEATFALTDFLGSTYSVFDGGIRIYWPAMRATDSPFRHRLWTRAKLFELRDERRDLVHEISRSIMTVSAGAAAQDGPIWRKTREVLAKVHGKRHLDAVRAAKAAADAAQLVSAATVTDLAERIDDLLERSREKDEIIARLEVQLREKDAAFVLYEQQRAEEAEHAATAVSIPVQRDVTTIETVADAVAAAEEDFPILRLWQSARESARESPAQPAHARRTYETLRVLATVGENYLSATARGERFQLDQALAAAGAPKYAPKDSKTTTSKYGNERTFTENGRRYTFKRHFRFGQGSRENCVQIYFEFDEGTQRIDVGYVGLHLTIETD